MTVGTEEVFIILLMIILIISVVLTVYPVFSGVAHNKCIMQQWALINSLDRIMNLVKERGAPVMNYSFLVMDCTECVWYDPINSQWGIKHSDEEKTNKSVSYNILGVSQNCLSCDDPKIGGVKCANMVGHTTYDFEIGENYVRCNNCPNSPSVCDYLILFNRRPKQLTDNNIPDRHTSLVTFQDKLYVFYQSSSDVYYQVSSDGMNWEPAIKLTDSAHQYGYPSATVYRGELYVSYSMDDGCSAIPWCSGWDVLIKKTNDGVTWSGDTRLTDDENVDGFSHLAVFNDKLYVFYYDAAFNVLLGWWYSNINYKDFDGTTWGAEVVFTDNSKVYTTPSATVHDDKLYVSYAASSNREDDSWLDDWEIYVTCLSGCSEMKITENSKTNMNSELFSYNGRLYTIYDEGDGDFDNSPGSSSYNIYYRAYDGTNWLRQCGLIGGEKPKPIIKPTVTFYLTEPQFCYSMYDTDWEIYC